MRKYLMASAALLGLAVAAGGAQAANLAPTDAFQNAGTAGAPKSNPDPGKIIVRIAGLFAVDTAIVNTTADKSAVNSSKLQNYGMAGYFRLYFGVDGRMTNGLIYGANSEMRTIFAGGQPVGFTGTQTIGNASANSAGSLWFTRRAYGYIGGDSWGILRIGQGDGPLSLFNGNSTGEFYSTGGWDGDACNFISQGCVAWFFPVVGNEYDSNKFTWISPKMNGFNLGVSFAPSSAALSGNDGFTATSGASQRQATSTIASDVTRPRNIFEIAGRYSGTLGALGVDAILGYSGSGVVSPASAAALPAGVTKVNGLSVFDAGLTVALQGFQVFGHLTTGKMNGSFTPQVKLASGRTKDGLAWVAGVAYGQGPWIVGTSYVSIDSQGSNGGTGNRTERGIAVGGTYTVAPGLDFFLEYVYGTRQQAGVNFRDGGAGLATADNKITSNILIGTMLVRW